MDNIRVFLVDDHKMIRKGIKTILDDVPEIEIVGEADNGVECLNVIKPEETDLVMTDLSMPGMDGIELTKLLKDKYPEIKIIALTMISESYTIKQILAEGVMGYLLKNCGEDEIKMAIKRVYEGGTYYSPEVTNIIIDNIRKVKPKPISRVSMEMPLSDREMEVLHLIIKEFSNSEIAEKLFVSVRTVDAHKRNLLDKTGCKNMAGLVLYAIERSLFEDI